MRIHVVLRYIGFVLLLNSIFLFISLLISIAHSDSSQFAFLYTTFLTTLFGIFPLIFVPAVSNISSREGIYIVVFGWVLTCFFGALPFYLYGGEFTFINAIFESVSGYTTTGASILSQVENLPKGILFWRSATHWLGGVGIIMFVLVIIPNIGQASLVLFQSEMSRLAKENFKFRTKTAIQVLLWVYVGLTVSETLLLMVFGMDWFDAVCHTFATVATGGFSTRNMSIATFNSPYIELVIVIFMFLSGIHFALLFATVMFRRLNIFRSEVVRYFFLFTFVSFLLLFIDLHYANQFSIFNNIRHSTFQAVSMVTTTGFATADTNLWPLASQIILIFLSIHCACSGSTASGIKSDRFLIFWKTISRNLKKIRHPNAIIHVKIDKRIVNEDIINNVLTYIILYIVVLGISSLLSASCGVNLLTAFTGSVATLGNVGPGLGEIGSLGNFNGIPDSVKIIFSGNMLLGRLEIFLFLSIFSKK